jgi:hypothetical protein
VRIKTANIKIFDELESISFESMPKIIEPIAVFASLDYINKFIT